MPRWQWRLFAFVTAAVVALAVFGAWVMASHNDGRQSTSGFGTIAPATTSAQVCFTSETARQLELQLTSRNSVTYRSAWAHGNVPPMMPVDSTLTVAVDSFVARQNIGSVQAIATVPGKPPCRLRMLLLARGGRWKIISIEEVK